MKFGKKEMDIAMKKIVAVLMIFVFVLSFASCSGHPEKTAGEVFSKLKTTYGMMDDIAEDILTAWDKGINNAKSIKGYTESGYYYKTTSYDYEKGLGVFTDGLNLEEDDVYKGIAYAYYGDDYKDSVDVTSKQEVAEVYEKLFYKYTSDFSACVDIVTAAYEVNGTLARVEDLLEICKKDMKKMGNKHSDYDLYSDLKSYYVNAMLLFDFCSDPTGTYNEAESTVNICTSTEKTCYFSLYCFLDDAIAKTDEDNDEE